MGTFRHFQSIDQVEEELAGARYIADRSLATVLFLSYRLQKPVFLEGEPGVGKTEVAVVMARLFETELIRLQCYEGLDASAALYEWNYPKQLLHLRLEEQGTKRKEEIERTLYGPEFLIQRPLLQAVMGADHKPPVLLIDEIDRSDEEFEAFLLEILADFQVTIPEIGTFKARERPLVVVTSNRTRDVHDALKRRCLYHWIDYPSFEKELRIVKTRLPGIDEALARQVTRFMQKVRSLDFLKKPGVSETLDWARALIAMERRELDPEVVRETLGCILKYQDDIRMFERDIWQDPEKRGEYLEPDSDG
ncbi:MAG: MoxR family ATPase [Deltaproteobacteria bacterium]|nr:MoxR family ATPase [Deltaproteobacteria bacterium]MBW2016496.1 MoxR family ATPase [Deltaproteobacteria bacterium]MBW2128500.1 MoxR family ATPase [Deltaproteobacteria bacterium]MBW2303641.1 MoxR family ATPase [Deltaproteobacteria bacterium]